MTLAPPRLPANRPVCRDDGAASEPEALIGEARGRQRKRRVRSVIALLLVAGLGGGLYGGFGGTSGPAPTLPVIEHNLATALEDAQTSLLLRVNKHRTKSAKYVTAVEWVDLANGQTRMLEYDAHGRLKTDTSSSATRSATATAAIARTIVTVSYPSQTWLVQTPTFECGRYCRRAPPPSGACGCDLDPFTNNLPRKPRVSLLGNETIDGKSTFHLRFLVSGVDRSTTDFWIDRSTYLPVHETVFVPETSYRREPTYTVTNDFTWVPRTTPNLGELKAVVPRAFKRTTSQRYAG